MTTTIKDFCIANNIEWFPIYLELVEGKEGKMEKKLSMINHPAYDGLPKQTDFGTLSKEQLAERQSILNYSFYNHVKHIAMDTRNIYHIDIDVPEYDEIFNNIAERAPYFKSATKSYGKHILIKSDTFIPTSKRHQFKCKGVELLCGQWSYAPIDGEMFHDDTPVGDIKLEELLDIIPNNNKEKIVRKRIIHKARVIHKADEVKENIKKNEKYIDIENLIKCFSIERATQYDTWLNAMFMIANELKEDGEDLFIEFSKKSPSFSEYDCHQFYEKYLNKSQNENACIGIKSGHYWAKADNKALHEQLFPQNLYISIDDLTDIYKTSVIITNTLKTSLVLCNEEWYMLDINTQLWKKQKEPSFYVITEIRKYIDYSNKTIVNKIALTEGEEKEKLIELSKKYLSSYNRINQPSYFSVVVKYLRPQLADDTFTSKLDNNPGKLAFKNGIYDLETNIFRNEILADDFVTDTIPFNYTPADEKKQDFIRKKLKEIMNNNEEHLEYLLSVIGYSFIGNAHLEKAFYCCIDGTDNGKGDNGKTLFYEILTMLFPCYVYKSDCSLIENDNKKAHKQLVRTKGKRLVWVDEYKQNKKADYTLLKQLAEGKTKENEVMFGTTETLRFMFKLFVLSNHKFTIPAAEEAVYNRYNEIPYTSHFDRTGKITTPNPNTLEFIADVTLLDNIVNNYKNEVAGLIIEYAHKYYVNKLPSIPAFFKTKTMDTRRHNDSFIEWFEDNCEACDSGKVALKIMVNTYGKGETELKEGMKRLGYKYNKELKGIGKDESGKYYKGGYEGVKFKEFEKDGNTEEP